MKTSVFDRGVLETWREIDPRGWKQLAIEVIDASLLMIAQDTERLRTALKSGDRVAVSRAAHSMKSTCGNVGIRPAVPLFLHLEKFSESSADPLEPLVLKACEIVTQALPELRAYRAELQVSRKVSS